MRQNRNQCRPCSAHRDPSLRSFAAQTSKNRSQNPVFPQPARAFPPRVLGNPAAGSAKGSGPDQKIYFKRCVANSGRVDDAPAK
jgi:hypothetical protein